MYFGLGKSLVYANYPANSARTVISTYGSIPMFLDVQNEGGQDVIYFCTRGQYIKYNFQTDTEETLVTFGNKNWAIGHNDDVDSCIYLRHVDRILLISRDKVGVWGLSGGAWAELFTPKRRFWYPYKVRV
jgi:hypothetical protein